MLLWNVVKTPFDKQLRDKSDIHSQDITDLASKMTSFFEVLEMISEVEEIPLLDIQDDVDFTENVQYATPENHSTSPETSRSAFIKIV
jgi:hypothetical protein